MTKSKNNKSCDDISFSDLIHLEPKSYFCSVQPMLAVFVLSHISALQCHGGCNLQIRSVLLLSVCNCELFTSHGRIGCGS